MDKTKSKIMKEQIEDLDDAELGSLEDQKKRLKERFFDACKNGNVEYLKKNLDNELLDILEPDENKWSCLQWAVVKNQKEAVKVIYNKYKQLEEEQEKIKKEKEKEKNFARKLNPLDQAFSKPLNPADNGKYTPLHWSAYKGYDEISSVLIKLGCDPLAVDSYGDNALHQACAGNHYNTVKLFMSLNIDLEFKNTRSHRAIDLTTNEKVTELINKALSKKACSICNKSFDFNNKRYVCFIKEDIICKNCCVIDYYYDSEDAEEKDMRYCRCKICQQEIKEAEDALIVAIQSNNLETLNKQFEESTKFSIDLHLLKLAKLNKDRLTREKQITDHLDSLKEVSNHKTIIKSVFLLDEMLKSAEENKVKLDPGVIKRAFLEKNRLLAEKDLRKLLANITIFMANQENLDNLNQKVDNAKKCNVAESYMQQGETLSENIRLNLDANDTLTKFKEYPLRVYPEPEVVDPKKKSK